MTDPIRYENGGDDDVQLDVYDVLQLIEEAERATAKAAWQDENDPFAGQPFDEWQDETQSLGEWLNEQDESSEDYYARDADDDFSFLPDGYETER